MSTRFLTTLSALLLAVCVCGCGAKASRPSSQQVPVTGMVTLDGKPLAGADVTFTCNDPAGIFSGATDDNGKYQLWSNFGGSNTIKGACKVKISKLALPAGATPKPGMSPMMLGAKESLPPKYSDGVKSILKADVPATGGEIDFKLVSR